MKLSIEGLKNPKLNIHIIGAAAVEGSAIARFLFQIGSKKVTLHDFCKKEEYQKRFLSFHNGIENRGKLWQLMKKLPYRIYFADQYLQDIESADLIFLPQAWYKYDFNYPRLAKIVEEKKVAVSNLIDLFLQLFPGITVGVTGTHGKTTVTRLIGHVLKIAGKNGYVSGNDRHSEQILELLAQSEKFHSEDILVLEISNRHLKQYYDKSPHIAVITNIYPNHLDEHESIDEYREVKKSIAAKQGPDDYLILGPGDDSLREWGEELQEKCKIKSLKFNIGKYKEAEKRVIFAGKDVHTIETKFRLPMALPGAHNHVNVMIAYEVCKLLGISEIDFQKGLDSFQGVEKRLEKIYEDQKMVVINDLAATTPEATKTAILAFPNKEIILILGGDDKNIPENAWKDFLQTAKSVILIALPGTVRSRLQQLKAHFIPVESFVDALEKAQKCINEKPVVVLISPAGEGFYTKFLQGVNLRKVLNSKLALSKVEGFKVKS